MLYASFFRLALACWLQTTGTSLHVSPTTPALSAMQVQGRGYCDGTSPEHPLGSCQGKTENHNNNGSNLSLQRRNQPTPLPSAAFLTCALFLSPQWESGKLLSSPFCENPRVRRPQVLVKDSNYLLLKTGESESATVRRLWHDPGA